MFKRDLYHGYRLTDKKMEHIFARYILAIRIFFNIKCLVTQLKKKKEIYDAANCFQTILMIVYLVLKKLLSF